MVKQKLILDAGSGIENSLFHHPLKTNNVIHIDINPNAYHLETLCDIQHLPFRPKSFSIVNASHILEHINNPLKAIKEIAYVSNKAIIKIPNALYCSYTGESNEHIYTWNQHTLKNILSKVFSKVIIKETILIRPKSKTSTIHTFKLIFLTKILKPNELTAVCING